MTKKTIFKQLGSVLALVGVLSFMTTTIAPRRAEALIGSAVAGPVVVATGAVIMGVAVAGAAGLATYGVRFCDVGLGCLAYLGMAFYIGAPLLAVGLIVLPADLAGQYRFPELQSAPQGISESEFAEYVRDRATLEVLAQDVRAEVARDIVTEAQWKSMSESEQKSWAEGRIQVAGKLWAEYVNEGLVSEGSLKTLAAVSQK